MLRRKILLFIFGFVVCCSIFAGNDLGSYKPGFYLGLGVGYGRTNEGSGPKDYINKFSSSKNINKKKIGGRLYAGYSFSPYFGLELGSSAYPSNYYKSANCEIKTKKNGSVDFSAKGIFPLEHLSGYLRGWHLFGKLGVAALRTKIEITQSGVNRNSKTLRARPFYGLGVGYDFTDHFGVDISYLEVYSWDKIDIGDINNSINNGRNINKVCSANLVVLGISYKF